METSFEEWIAGLPLAVTSDPMWRWEALRLAMWAAELAVHDARMLRSVPMMKKLSEQLVTAVGSIAANLSEGASRSTPLDRARFVGYALGSTRESITWYTQSRAAFSARRLEIRLDNLLSIRRLLTATSRNLHRQLGPEFSWKRKEG